jgi:hypothetical protein
MTARAAPSPLGTATAGTDLTTVADLEDGMRALLRLIVGSLSVTVDLGPMLERIEQGRAIFASHGNHASADLFSRFLDDMDEMEKLRGDLRPKVIEAKRAMEAARDAFLRRRASMPAQGNA